MNKINKKINIIGIFIGIIFLIMVIILLNNHTNDSAAVTGYYVYPSNEGTEETQKINVVITYDKKIQVKKDHPKDLRIVIADKRIKENQCNIAADKNDSHILNLTIPIDGIEDGNLLIEPTHDEGLLKQVKDIETKSSVYAPEIQCIIPTGVELKTQKNKTGNENTYAFVTAKVTHTWKVRSILWIGLTENDQMVEPNSNYKDKRYNGAIAIHGHDFLSYDSYSAAREIANELEKYYGDRYNVTNNKDTFSIESKEMGEKQLDIKINTGQKIGGASLSEQ